MTQNELDAWSDWKMRGSPEADSRLNENSRRRADAKRTSLGGTATLYGVNYGDMARDWDGAEPIRNFGADWIGPRDAELVAMIEAWRAMPAATAPRVQAIEAIHARAEAIGAERLDWS